MIHALHKFTIDIDIDIAAPVVANLVTIYCTSLHWGRWKWRTIKNARHER